MQGGYVLDYTDATFGEFFWTHEIDIHAPKYQQHGSSKAKKLRAFWSLESDDVVARVLNALLNVYITECKLNNRPISEYAVAKVREAIGRLSEQTNSSASAMTVTDFLRKEFPFPNVEKLPIDAPLAPIVESRLAEAEKTLSAGAYLATCFLCGSILEAVLLGVARKNAERFNRAAASPKLLGVAKRFDEWSLAQFIDASTELGFLQPDVRKYCHGLRDFRNYIHPMEQVKTGFAPDKHTASLCLQALKAALASVAGERG